MADDVVLLGAGRPPMRGKAEFAAATRAAEGTGRIEGTAKIQEIQVSGDLAVLLERPDGRGPSARRRDGDSQGGARAVDISPDGGGPLADVPRRQHARAGGPSTRMNDGQHLARIGAVAAISGSVIAFIATALHPMSADRTTRPRRLPSMRPTRGGSARTSASSPGSRCSAPH